MLSAMGRTDFVHGEGKREEDTDFNFKSVVDLNHLDPWCAAMCAVCFG